MALRTNIRFKTKQSLLLKILKISLFVCAVIVAIATCFVLYFNGQNAKAPILKFLSDRTNLTINCEKVEFSPLYPNVIKLGDVSLNKSHIDEIYMEYNLSNLLTSKP